MNCDISDKVNADIIFDIEKGAPFVDNFFSEVVMDNVLEHMKDRLFVMDEIYRVCKNGSIVKIKVPYCKHTNADVCLDHYGKFNYRSFETLDKSKDKKNWWGESSNFKTIYRKLYFNKWHIIVPQLFEMSNKFKQIYEDYLVWFAPARELEIHLEVVK